MLLLVDVSAAGGGVTHLMQKEMWLLVLDL